MSDMKINSRAIMDLRPDVSANCQTLLDECKKAGFKAGLACTYRNQEYQAYLHQLGKAPANVTFHGADTDGKPSALAFDVYENLNGTTSYRDEFFNFIAPLAKKMGFTWMNDITGKDKPHFQWDNHGLISGTLIRSGMMPPPMALYKADKTAEYKANIKQHVTFSEATWQYLDKYQYAEALYKQWAESYK